MGLGLGLGDVGGGGVGVGRGGGGLGLGNPHKPGVLRWCSQRISSIQRDLMLTRDLSRTRPIIRGVFPPKVV